MKVAITDEKRAFFASLVPRGVPFDPASGVLHVNVNVIKTHEIVLLDVDPSDETIKRMQNAYAPTAIRFESTVYQYESPPGCQKQKRVVSATISLAHFRQSPYRFWFATYPRAVAAFVALLLTLGFCLYYFST